MNKASEIYAERLLAAREAVVRLGQEGCAVLHIDVGAARTTIEVDRAPATTLEGALSITKRVGGRPVRVVEARLRGCRVVWGDAA